MKFFHGSESEISNFLPRCIYISNNIETAKIYASEEKDGKNPMFLYSVEIEESDIEFEADFDCLDCGGYLNPEAWDKPVVLHSESGYAFIKNASNYQFKLVN